MPEAKKPDLFEVIVDNANERDDEVQAVGEEAKAEVDAAAILRRAKTGDELVRLVVEAGIRASVRRLGAQKAMAIRQVREEGRALIANDPRSLRPITDVDMAARRAKKMGETPEEK